MFFLGQNFVSGLLLYTKVKKNIKKPFKNLKNLGFFSSPGHPGADPAN